MNKKTLISVLVVAVIVIGGVLVWQGNNFVLAPLVQNEDDKITTENKDEISGTIPTKDTPSETPKEAPKPGEIIIEPDNPENTGLTPYPDLALTSDLSAPVSVKFVIEHRSALNGKTITVSGLVVGTLLGEKACPPDRGACAQPSVFLADSTSDGRNKLYDLRVLVSEADEESSYPMGGNLKLQVLIEGNQISVIGRKI